MKRLVILLLIVCPLMASAKTTLRTMLVEGKTWYYSYHHYNDEEGKFDDQTYRVSYTVKGDTVIGEREYKKMYRWDEVSRQTRYYGAFREDEDGRVWQYDYAGHQKDFMICDITTYYYFEEADVAVEDVIDINGKLLKRYQRRGLIGLEGVGLQKYGIILYPLAPEPDCYCDYETFEYMLDDEFIFYNSFFNLPTYIQLTENEKKMVEQNNDFAFNLFRKARTGESKVLSPLSITYALGMLNNGAGGQTQQEINTVLGFDDVAAQNEFCQKITNGLLTAGYTDNTTKAILSNTIFVNKGRGYELQQDFTHTVNNYYYAYPQSRDFNDGETRGVINQWASDHTEGMVQEVLSEQEFDPNAVDYLLNATYFKGMWSRPFEIENTTDKPFAGGEKVPMMGQHIQTTYAENNLYQTVSLPYGNGTYTMQVFLPREGKTLDEVLESLNGKNWQINGNNYEVGLELPRFEIETNQDLVHVMSALGMPSAFNPGTADFSHMCPIITDGNNIGGNIYIDMMKQVAKIKVDEMGSRAAAVTTSGVLPTSLPPYASFCANRPFFYIISEQSTGVILFMGQYMGNHPEGKEDPTKSIAINEENFPDENFRNWVLSQEYGDDGVLTNVEIAKVTRIDVSNKGIQNLKGIEYFTGLTGLNCASNRLTTLDVSKNTGLKTLICFGNPLTSLDLSGCTVLKDLWCYSNQIKGKEMDALVESLPTVDWGFMYAIHIENEQNVMTTTQVAAAKAKGWRVYYYDRYDWFVYAGSEPAPQNEYRPFVEEGKVWTYHYHGYNGREFNVGRVMDGDTIISGQKYKKIYDKIGGQYQYALREEGKKVYMVDDHYETESLLYDFSKKAGDVIDELEHPLIVASVDTIDIDGVKFRRMRVQDANQPIEEWDDEMINMYNFWIEGVGSECLLESSIREPGNDYNLLSCQINGRVYTQQELLATNPKKIGLDQYLPFVQAGKRWTVNQSYVDKENLDEMTYSLSYDEVSENGNQYYNMPRSLNGNLVDDEPVMIREKNRRVYLHFPYTKYEYLMFDYSLKAGDTYWTYSLDEQKAVKYEVLSVSDFTEGPEFVYREYDEKGDSMKTYTRYLRKWVVERINKPIQKTWIEGIGSIEGPLANFYDVARTSGRDYLAYVELGRLDYLPFEFNDTVNYRWHGCNLPTGAEDNWEEDFHKLTYELEGNRLHVYGKALTQCGPNNYAYFKEEPTDDPLTYRIRFYIQEVEPTMDCMALHATDFYVSGFNPNLNYIVVDNQGVEHPVINKTPQNEYRQFVEDGKVWIVKVESDGWPKEEWTDYYYLDGDTIVAGQTAKRMMCVKGEGIEFGVGNIEPIESVRYIGAWYEKDKKVYFASKQQETFELLYDFTLATGDSILFNGNMLIVNKVSGGIQGFKGTYYKIGDTERWLEGVGSENCPHANFTWNGNKGTLIACTVDDEVIYLNEQLADEVSHDRPDYAKKRRFDFTHTTKIQPKAPGNRSEAIGDVYGEYNSQQLNIVLGSLDDTYLVRIINQKTGETLYEKAINAGNIVALNIDISEYPEGQYEITIDNSNETFNGVFDTTATGIGEIIHNSQFIMHNKAIFNLNGQRIKQLQKGLNIVDGKKVWVK